MYIYTPYSSIPPDVIQNQRVNGMQLFITLYTFALSFGIASASILSTRARVVPLDEIYTLSIYAPCKVECNKLHVTHQTLSGLFNGTSFEDFPADDESDSPERKAAEIQFDSTTQREEPRQFWLDHVPSNLHLVCNINFAKRPITSSGLWRLSQASGKIGEVGDYGQYTEVEGANGIWVACAKADDP